MKNFTCTIAALATATAVALAPMSTAHALSSLSSSSGEGLPTSPAPHVPSPSYPGPDADQATESIRSALEFYQEQRFDNIIDPRVQPIADHCVALGANGEISLNETVDLSYFGYPGSLCLVQTHRLDTAERTAETLRKRALDYHYSDGRSSQVAVGAIHRGNTIFTSIVNG